MTAVTPSMVKTLDIGFCRDGMGMSGCFHMCTVTLSDGEERYDVLPKTSIESLIESVAVDKIDYTPEASHFTLPSGFKKLSAESILTGLFSVPAPDLSRAEV